MEIIPALGPASEWADEVDAVSDALLPLAGDLHAGVVVVDDEEGGGGQLQVVLLLEVLRRPGKMGRCQVIHEAMQLTLIFYYAITFVVCLYVQRWQIRMVLGCEKCLPAVA